MLTANQLLNRVHKVSNYTDFSSLALEVFEFQYKHNEIYQKYCVETGRDRAKVNSVKEIPFLPIEFFKTHNVTSVQESEIEKTFCSSGTTDAVKSKHLVANLDFYKSNSLKIFSSFYDHPSEYVFLSLLPGYLERNDSSLVYMMEHFNHESKHDESGFYLNNIDDLEKKIQQINRDKKKCILLGVTHALLALSNRNVKLSESFTVMETGGMKGQGRELIREELHEKLKNGLGVNAIHSEYGMTELLSQAYSKQDGKFFTPAWMKIFIRDIYDPFSFMEDGKSGSINIIDLANVCSCSFIATSDLGKINSDNSFEVLGRMDNSDVRGCNLLYSS